MLPSSTVKTSSFKNNRKKLKIRPVSDSHSIGSISELKNSSDIISELEN